MHGPHLVINEEIFVNTMFYTVHYPIYYKIVQDSARQCKTVQDSARQCKAVIDSAR